MLETRDDLCRLCSGFLIHDVVQLQIEEGEIVNIFEDSEDHAGALHLARATCSVCNAAFLDDLSELPVEPEEFEDPWGNEYYDMYDMYMDEEWE